MCLFTRSRVLSALVSADNPGTNLYHRGTEITENRLLVRNHSLHFWRIGVADQSRSSAQVASCASCPSKSGCGARSLRTLYFSGPSLLEALRSAFVCF